MHVHALLKHKRIEIMQVHTCYLDVHLNTLRSGRPRADQVLGVTHYTPVLSRSHCHHRTGDESAVQLGGDHARGEQRLLPFAPIRASPCS